MTRIRASGASLHFVGDTVTGHVEMPGTGSSYREALDDWATHEELGTRRRRARVLCWLSLDAVVVYVLLR